MIPKKLTILTYHRIGRNTDFIARGMGGPGVAVEDFAAQMKYLSAHSRLVSLGEALRIMAAGRDDAESLMVITFDDGYRDNYTQAWPVLRQYKIPATIFLVAGRAGSGRLIWQHRLYYLQDVKGTAWVAEFLKAQAKYGDTIPIAKAQLGHVPIFPGILGWFKEQGDLQVQDALLDRMWALAGLDASLEESLARQSYLQWPEILEMSAAGVEFGSHSFSHPNLAGVHGEALHQEIAGSKDLLQRKLGKEIASFCYPYGDAMAINEDVVREVRKAGYKGACTTAWGVNVFGNIPSSPDPYRLRRKAVSYARRMDMWLEFSGIKDRLRKWMGVSLGILCAVGLGIAGGGCSSSGLDEADKKIQDLRLELQSDPGNTASHYQLGLLLHDKGEHEEAVYHFAQGAKDPNLGVSAQFQIAMIEYERGRYEGAVAILENIQQDHREFPFPEIHYHIGRIYLREGKTSDAVKGLKKSIDLGYSHQAAHFLLGDTLFRMGNFTEAVDYLRKYLQVDPQSPIVRLNLGKALDSMGKKEEAKKEFRVIKENTPWLRQANLVVLENFRFRQADQWVVRGVLKNMSIIKLLDVRAQANLLDLGQKIRNDQSGLVTPPNLYPNQEGSFEFRFPFDVLVKSHEVKGSGRIPQEHVQEEIDWLDRVS